MFSVHYLKTTYGTDRKKKGTVKVLEEYKNIFSFLSLKNSDKCYENKSVYQYFLCPKFATLMSADNEVPGKVILPHWILKFSPFLLVIVKKIVIFII